MPRRKNRYASYYDASIDDQTLDNELATEKTDGLMSKEDKIKLDKISVGEGGDLGLQVNASDVIVDKENQFVSEQEKQKLESIEVNEDGKLTIDAENITPTDDRQFISADMLKRLESAVVAHYDEERQCIVFESVL